MIGEKKSKQIYILRENENIWERKTGSSNSKYQIL